VDVKADTGVRCPEAGFWPGTIVHIRTKKTGDLTDDLSGSTVGLGQALLMIRLAFRPHVFFHGLRLHLLQFGLLLGSEHAVDLAAV